MVTNYTDPRSTSPSGITAGPDGALWFTNRATDSIGRITTAGAVSNYTGPSIYAPDGITTGPDGALWFTNDGNSIGRITTAGVGDQLHRWRASTDPMWHHGRARRRAVVHQLRQQLDRADHHGWDVERLHGPDHSPSPFGITTGPDDALWFTKGRLHRTHHHRRGRDHLPRTGIHDPLGITAGSDGALWFDNQRQQFDRSDYHRRGGEQLLRPSISDPPTSPPVLTVPSGLPTLTTTDWADHHRRCGEQLHGTGISTQWHHRRP